MTSMLEAIHRRQSVRTYLEQDIEPHKLENIEEIISSPEFKRGPFGNEVNFVLFDMANLSEKEAKRLGTYGIIKGARYYIAGSMQEAEGIEEDFGYCMEKVILELTRMGLGTCWLAGTFRRKNFAARLGLQEGEILPAITPFGYPRDDRSIIEKTMRFFAKSRERKPWGEMFFVGDTSTSLDEKNAGYYAPVLEAVRVGPSASNKQPWVIIKEMNEEKFHLYLRRTPGYIVRLGKIKLQNLDLGIAMCHFELAAAEKKLPGQWLLGDAPPDKDTGDMEYIATWTGKS